MSSLPFQVFVVRRDEDGYEYKDWPGTTPGSVRVEGVWGVRARETMSLRDLVAAVRGTGIGALSLDNCAFDQDDLALLYDLPKLEWLDCDRKLGSVGFAHVGRLQGLRHLDLDGIRGDPDDFAQLVGLTELRTLDVSRSLTSDEVLRQVARLPRLERLFLWNSSATATGLGHLRHAPNLRMLHLGGDYSGSEALAGLVGHPTLRRLEFHFQRDFTARSLDDLGRLPALEELEFYYCDQQDTDGDAVEFDEKVFEQIARIPGLRSLALRHADVTDEGLARLGRLRHLERLAINDAEITDAGLRRLRDFPRLRYLELWDVDFGDEGLRACRYLPNLSELHLISGDDASDAGLAQLSTGLEVLRTSSERIRRPDLGRFRRLRCAWLRDSRFEDAGLASMAGLFALEELCLAETRVTSAGLVHLRALHNLRVLDLEKTAVDDRGLVHVAGLRGLENLDLGFTRITGAGLHLSGLDSLRDLDVSGTKIFSRDLAALPPNLETLDLRGTRVTAAAVPYVRRLKRLTRLLVDGTEFPRISRLGSCAVERFRDR